MTAAVYLTDWSLFLLFFPFLCSPHVEFAGYTTEHPVYRHINLRVQTTESSGVSGEAALAETLEVTKGIFDAALVAMDRDLEAWPARAEARHAAEAAAAGQRDAAAGERGEKMRRWLRMTVERSEVWDRDLEVELFGKVISPELERQAAAP
jgi:hypothetical protein